MGAPGAADDVREQDGGNMIVSNLEDILKHTGSAVCVNDPASEMFNLSRHGKLSALMRIFLLQLSNGAGMSEFVFDNVRTPQSALLPGGKIATFQRWLRSFYTEWSTTNSSDSGSLQPSSLLALAVTHCRSGAESQVQWQPKRSTPWSCRTTYPCSAEEVESGSAKLYSSVNWLVNDGPLSPKDEVRLFAAALKCTSPRFLHAPNFLPLPI